MATHKDSIRNLFVDAENRWMFTGEITNSFPDVPKQSLYSVISSMFKNEELRSQQVSGGKEYSLPEVVYEAERLKRLARADRQGELALPVISEEQRAALAVNPCAEVAFAGEPGMMDKRLKIPENACSEILTGEVPINEIPEGVSGKRRHVVWDQQDKEMFALNYARIIRDRPVTPFSAASVEAINAMPESKHRQIFNRQQIAWFDEELEKARHKLHLADQRAAEEEEQRKRETEQQRTMQNFKDTAREMPMDIFMGEVMRRGSALIEGMFIQALTSPRVRDAMVSAFGERRNGQRHDPNHGQTDDRVKLKKILIYGLNKPVQQNEIKNTFGELFDLRFLAVRANPGQMKAMVRPVDLVIVLKDHVNHSDVSIIEAEGAKFVRIDGGIGNLRTTLHEMNK